MRIRWETVEAYSESCGDRPKTAWSSCPWWVSSRVKTCTEAVYSVIWYASILQIKDDLSSICSDAVMRYDDDVRTLEYMNAGMSWISDNLQIFGFAKSSEYERDSYDGRLSSELKWLFSFLCDPALMSGVKAVINNFETDSCQNVFDSISRGYFPVLKWKYHHK